MVLHAYLVLILVLGTLMDNQVRGCSLKPSFDLGMP